MTDRENALEVIRFGSPERVPGKWPCHAITYHGGRREGYDDDPGQARSVGETWTDIWGTVYRKEHEDLPPYPCEYPLPDVSRLRSYRWPDPDDERICGRIYEMADEFPGGDLFFSGNHTCVLWQRAYKLVGMQDLMTCFYAEPNFVREVFRRVMDFHLGIAGHFLKLGVESVGFSEDLGTQTGPMFGPDIMEEFFLPEYRRIFSLYKERGVIVGMHSCGNIESYLDMFMDLGLDILNPIQVTANDLDSVRAKTHGRLALHGAVSNVTVTDGPVEAIEAEVRQRLWQLGRDGGYICGVDQHMPAPDEHRQALRDAAEEYGAYPLGPPPD